MLRVIDIERAALREEMRVLDNIARQLRDSAGGGAVADAGKREDEKPRKHRARPGSKQKQTDRSPAAVAKRDGDILRFLRDHGPAISGQIRTVVPSVGPKARLASLKRLEGEGLVLKSGPPKKPTYEAVDRPEIAQPQPPQEATLGGQVLALIQEGDGASKGELIARTGATEEQVRAECGQLIREGEIAHQRRDGAMIYVPQVSA